MPRVVDARDVLDADAITGRAFEGRVIGVFRRRGPNAWDDYVLVEEDGGPIDVLPGIPIHVEKEGAAFRMRRRGEVVLVEWAPEDGESGSSADLRERFLTSCVRDEDPTPEGSLAAWLHGELDEKPEASD